MTVHIAVQADATGSIPCTVRATAPRADSSYTGLGKLGIRLGEREHLVPVDTQAALNLHAALRRRSPAPGELTWLDTNMAKLCMRVLPRPHLA
ncbi:hypothetical protein [Pseudoclavibacter sp. AY1H1]|uniref:hypothetical protein n=1 Tax=Pseudoclavibacter sp. AY1H1 TaxID=2080584 RepID=UPI000CE87423|nr:hypothetical protein [Pseudoclavibacter sp. AY1H1]PPF38528.1 hypothetical protein C5E05_05850 [Pseudoclavibacter sp. AY1H1]